MTKAKKPTPVAVEKETKAKKPAAKKAPAKKAPAKKSEPRATPLDASGASMIQVEVRKRKTFTGKSHNAANCKVTEAIARASQGTFPETELRTLESIHSSSTNGTDRRRLDVQIAAESKAERSILLTSLSNALEFRVIVEFTLDARTRSSSDSSTTAILRNIKNEVRLIEYPLFISVNDLIKATTFDTLFHAENNSEDYLSVMAPLSVGGTSLYTCLGDQELPEAPTSNRLLSRLLESLPNNVRNDGIGSGFKVRDLCKSLVLESDNRETLLAHRYALEAAILGNVRLTISELCKDVEDSTDMIMQVKAYDLAFFSHHDFMSSIKAVS